PQRRRGRGLPGARRPRLRRAAPPGGGPGPARRPLPVRRLHHPHDTRRKAAIMPRRTDLESVLIIGSGPIVIGQACEFDYSGTQACKALREEGLRVVLINSNPATIMTDPELANATYIEPLTVEVLDKVLAHEKVSAILPTLGGQTGLNLAMAAAKAGLLEKHGVELLGASVKTIEMAEDRELFKQAMARIGLACPRSRLVTSVEEARAVVDEIGFPAI